MGVAQRYSTLNIVVVDNTDKYEECVTEEIRSTSHFNKTVEYVVVIDG